MGVGWYLVKVYSEVRSRFIGIKSLVLLLKEVLVGWLVKILFMNK
jgi:hypothetical protein